MHKQRGITLGGLLMASIVVVLVVIAALKIMPDVIDYLAIVKNIKAVAQDPALRDANVAEIRRAFERRMQIDNVSAITGSDLDIAKQGSDIVINVAYTKKIPLSGNVSLVIDFEGSSGK